MPHFRKPRPTLFGAIKLATLATTDEAASKVVASIVAEEQLHHDQSATHMGTKSFCTKPLQAFVSGATEAVIWTGMRV